VEKIEIVDIRDNVFYALISLVNNGNRVTVDARPSDAIAIALRSGCSIFVADQVVREAIRVDAAKESEEKVIVGFEQDKEKLKDILEKMNPRISKFKRESDPESDRCLVGLRTPVAVQGSGYEVTAGCVKCRDGQPGTPYNAPVNLCHPNRLPGLIEVIPVCNWNVRLQHSLVPGAPYPGEYEMPDILRDAPSGKNCQ
jgi:hypothetical protein